MVSIIVGVVLIVLGICLLTMGIVGFIVLTVW